MAGDDKPEPQKLKPLTLWEKVKAGGKAMISYLPRGVMWSLTLMGGSLLLGSVSGGKLDLLGVAKIVQGNGSLLGFMIPTLAIGSVISVVAGVMEATSERNKAIAEQEGKAKCEETAHVPERQPEVAVASGLPMNTTLAKPRTLRIPA